MTKSARFTQGDITKVIRGAQVAGFQVKRISIEIDGRIVADLSGADDGPDAENEWDVVLRNNGRKAKPKL